MHIYFVRAVLLPSLFQSFDEWNDVGRVVNPKLAHHHHATSFIEFSYEVIVFISCDGWIALEAEVEGFVHYQSDMS